MPKKKITKKIKIQDDIQTVSIEKIRPNDYNPNQMDDEIFASLEYGIEKDGYLTPILVRKKTGIIIDGEHRWKAAKARGMKKILVQFIDVTKETAKQLTVAMNQRKGRFDTKSLNLLISDIQKKTKSISALDLGFTQNLFETLKIATMLGDSGSNNVETQGEGPNEPPQRESYIHNHADLNFVVSQEEKESILSAIDTERDKDKCKEDKNGTLLYRICKNYLEEQK